MSKGLHKNSLRKGDNPHQWMIDDLAARLEVIQQIRAEVELLQHSEIPHTDEWWDGADYVRRQIKAKLSEIEKSEKPINPTLQEQPVRPSVEDAMKELDEKIAKVKKAGSWKNPELLDEMRYEQPVWKPSKESMEALLLAIDGKCPTPTSYLSRRLEDLYDGLVNTYNIGETYLSNEQPVCHYGDTPSEERCRYCSASCSARVSDQPVCEDVNDEIKRYIKEYGYERGEDKLLIAITARHFAQWQKEQFEKNRLAACDAMTEEECKREMDFADEIINKEHRQPTFSDAINYGMRLQKEQMLKDAVEARVCSGMEGDKWIMTYVGDYESMIKLCKAGDKVKLIIIKED